MTSDSRHEAHLSWEKRRFFALFNFIFRKTRTSRRVSIRQLQKDNRFLIDYGLVERPWGAIEVRWRNEPNPYKLIVDSLIGNRDPVYQSLAENGDDNIKIRILWRVGSLLASRPRDMRKITYNRRLFYALRHLKNLGLINVEIYGKGFRRYCLTEKGERIRQFLRDLMYASSKLDRVYV